jgi:hypothetical protein
MQLGMEIEQILQVTDSLIPGFYSLIMMTLGLYLILEDMKRL